MQTVSQQYAHGRCLGGMLFLIFVLVGTAAASGPATLFKSLEESSGALLQAPTTMLPRSVLAVGPASPSQYLRGGGASDVLCFAQGLRTLPARHGPTSAARMCVPGREPVVTSNLKEQLEQAVREERYEDAARLRDLIKAQGVGPPAQTFGSGPPAGERKSDIRERLRQREISRLRDIDTDGDNMATPF